MIIETAILGELHRKRKLSNTHHVAYFHDEKNSGNQAIGVVHYRTSAESNIAFRKLISKARKINRDQAQRLLIGLAEGSGVGHECFAFDWLQNVARIWGVSTDAFEFYYDYGTVVIRASKDAMVFGPYLGTRIGRVIFNRLSKVSNVTVRI
jgi:hypothetical protein